MMTKRSQSLPYRRGDWVAVPLRDEGYAVGIIAQADGTGGATGYFFGPRRLSIPSVAELRTLGPSDAIYTCNFGDPGLVKGEWTVIGGHEVWQQHNWPVPAFGYIEGPGRPAWKVVYRDDHLAEYASREQVTVEECMRLPKTAVSGYIAVEKSLTRLLNGEKLYDPRARALELAQSTGRPISSPTAENRAMHEDMGHQDFVTTPSRESTESHAVLVHLPGSPEPISLAGVEHLEDVLVNAINEAGVGQLDGNEIDHQTGDVVVFTYGPDADRLAESINNVLRKQSLRPGTYLMKRYGEPGSREQRVDIQADGGQESSIRNA